MAYYPEANVLTGTQIDPRSKTPAFKSTPVRIGGRVRRIDGTSAGVNIVDEANS